MCIGVRVRNRAVLLGVFLFIARAEAAGTRVLSGHVPHVVRALTAVNSLEPTNQLTLSLGLPLRDAAGLETMLSQIYDPASPLYHQYITADQFAARFGPTEQDYQTLINYAVQSGLTVTSVHPNRTLLGVSASAGQIERALGIKLRLYQHPKEARLFFSNDSDPTVPDHVPLLHISGLNNFTLPHPMDLHLTPNLSAASVNPRKGSGLQGAYWGNDFRNAYVPQSALTGAGQKVGLFELNGYYSSDIAAYINQTGLPNVPLQNVLIDNFNGSAGGRRPGSANEEVALDIEMAISMAPGLTSVLVYEGAPTATIATINHVLNRMATDNLARQLSCSWGFDIDVNTEQIFHQFAAQGQSFYLASGDNGAYTGIVLQPSDSPFVTVVGGTDLNTDASQHWLSEVVWNGSSGGISSVFSIPPWQQGIDMSLNHGSTLMRNLPDVAMVADNVQVIADRGRTLPLSGTSIAAPLWAGFTALVNEQGAAEGKPPVGFVNPAIYAVGQSASYASAFHDITVGNNTNRTSFGNFRATRGYDLCTGWGSPNGSNFVTALLNVPVDPLRIDSSLGFTANGPVGGPFNVTTQLFVLTNLSGVALDWELVSTSQWLSVSAENGTLNAGASTNIIVSLNPNANQLLIGDFSATVAFHNLTSGSARVHRFFLHAGNGSFENGDFTDWTFVGDDTVNFADSLDSADYYGQSSLPGVDDSAFVHSGIYGAFLGENGDLATLSQTLPTTAGRQYVISFWLANPAEGAPNEFRAQWNDSVLFDQTDMPLTAWTNLQYVVTADSSSATLQFSFENDQNAFALDDVSVIPYVIPPPSLASVTSSAGSLQLSWMTVPGRQYQLQFASTIDASTWTDLGDPVSATDPLTTFTDTIDLGGQARFYRLVEL